MIIRKTPGNVLGEQISGVNVSKYSIISISIALTGPDGTVGRVFASVTSPSLSLQHRTSIVVTYLW